MKIFTLILATIFMLLALYINITTSDFPRANYALLWAILHYLIAVNYQED